MTDDDNGRVSLSRRKVLGALGASGAVVGLGGLGTMAQFTDTEDTWVTFTAGGVDGRVIGGASYNGEPVQDLDASGFDNLEDGISLEIDGVLDDIKPGDFGCFSFGIEVQNNPAWVASCIGYEDSHDNVVYEPEVQAENELETGDLTDDDIGAQDATTSGEIPENMLVIPFYKGANHPANQWNPCQFFDTENDEFNYQNYSGQGAVACPSDFWSNAESGLSPKTLDDAISVQNVSTQNWEAGTQPVPADYPDAPQVGEGCTFLNGQLSTDSNQQEAAALQPGDRIYFGYDWHVPFDVGNEMQGDSLTLKLGFNFSQLRHTDSAQLQNIYNPGANTPTPTPSD